MTTPRLTLWAPAFDAELVSVLVALQPLGERALQYVDRARREFSMDIHNEAWSSGERVVVDLARVLWAGGGPVDLVYILTSLGEPFFQAAVNAMAVRRREDFGTFADTVIDGCLV